MIINKITQKTQGWYSGYVSRAEKSILINSIINIIPTKTLLTSSMANKVLSRTCLIRVWVV